MRIRTLTLPSAACRPASSSPRSPRPKARWTGPSTSWTWTSPRRSCGICAKRASSGVSRKLRKQIEVEREQLHQAIKLHRPLLDRAGTRELDAIELSAAAAFLHSFYTGIENIFERIAIDLDGANPSGTRWHRDILDRMALAAGLRPR